VELNVIGVDIAKKVFQLHWVEAGSGSIERLDRRAPACAGRAIGLLSIKPGTQMGSLSANASRLACKPLPYLSTLVDYSNLPQILDCEGRREA
jgi:hypothetical protein